MIGQKNVMDKLKNTKAKTVLLTGNPHWGKKTLLRELFKGDEAVYEITGNASAFRESLERIYTTVRPTTYLIPDLDKANATIQNVLLKVLEEPPSSARFFLTASGPILPTIVSRCVTYRMEPYKDTNDELGGLKVDAPLIGIAKSPGQAKMLSFQGAGDLALSLVEIKKSIPTASLANVLKQVQEFHKKWKETNATQDVFLLLIDEIFKGTQAVEWARQQPQDGVRYVRTQFFMRVWLEVQGV